MPLIIHSNSTEKFVKNMAGTFLKINDMPVEKLLKIRTNEYIIAVGGGSVIDAAKIIAKNSNCNLILGIPTTASGAVETSHAVYWKNHKKYSMKTPKPLVIIRSEFLETLPKNIIRSTSYDALSQALESYWSKNSTDESRELALKAIEIVSEQIRNNYLDVERLIEGGNLSGKAIEITGTNIVHAISYPLTGFYSISHGLAVGFLLPAIADYVGCGFKIPKYEVKLDRIFDIDLIASEAMSYNQIHNAIKDIDKNQIVNILRGLCIEEN